MSNYGEHIEAMWEETEGKRAEKTKEKTEEKRFYETVEECKGCIASTEFGTLDLSENAIKDIKGGEKLTWNLYLKALFQSRNIQRHSFIHCYYSCWDCYFYGRIERMDRKKGKVLFYRIVVDGFYPDGDGYEGKEDHVWMDLKPFNRFKPGDCVYFSAEIYRYLKTRNGLQISYGLKNPEDIRRVESYHVPTDEELRLQAIDRIVCEMCLFKDHCNGTICLANEEWRDGLRQSLMQATAGEMPSEEED